MRKVAVYTPNIDTHIQRCQMLREKKTNSQPILIPWYALIYQVEYHWCTKQLFPTNERVINKKNFQSNPFMWSYFADADCIYTWLQKPLGKKQQLKFPRCDIKTNSVKIVSMVTRGFSKIDKWFMSLWQNLWSGIHRWSILAEKL